MEAVEFKVVDRDCLSLRNYQLLLDMISYTEKGQLGEESQNEPTQFVKSYKFLNWVKNVICL